MRKFYVLTFMFGVMSLAAMAWFVFLLLTSARVVLPEFPRGGDWLGILSVRERLQRSEGYVRDLSWCLMFSAITSAIVELGRQSEHVWVRFIVQQGDDVCTDDV